MPHAQSSEVCLTAETNNQKFSQHNKERILSLKYLLWPSHSYIPGPHVLLLCFTTYMEICQVQISGQLQNCSTGSWLVIAHTYQLTTAITPISLISVLTRGACAVDLALGRVWPFLSPPPLFCFQGGRDRKQRWNALIFLLSSPEWKAELGCTVPDTGAAAWPGSTNARGGTIIRWGGWSEVPPSGLRCQIKLLANQQQHPQASAAHRLAGAGLQPEALC